MGRKSRAKAVRRAERAQLVVRAESNPLGVASPGCAAITSAPETTSAVLAPPLPRLPGSGRSTAAHHLRRLVERQGELHGEIEDEVRRLLEQGQSWTVVADAIGISRQGARQRYRHLAMVSSGATTGIDGAAR